MGEYQTGNTVQVRTKSEITEQPDSIKKFQAKQQNNNIIE